MKKHDDHATKKAMLDHVKDLYPEVYSQIQKGEYNPKLHDSYLDDVFTSKKATKKKIDDIKKRAKKATKGDDLKKDKDTLQAEHDELSKALADVQSIQKELGEKPEKAKKTSKPASSHGEKSFKDMAQRSVHAENEMLELLQKNGGISREDAKKVMQVYDKHKILDRSDEHIHGRLKLKRGGFWEKDTIKRAVALADSTPEKITDLVKQAYEKSGKDGFTAADRDKALSMLQELKAKDIRAVGESMGIKYPKSTTKQKMKETIKRFFDDRMGGNSRTKYLGHEVKPSKDQSSQPAKSRKKTTSKPAGSMSQKIKSAISNLSAGDKYSGTKAYISQIHKKVAPGMPLDQFKGKLLDLHKKGDIVLKRIDLVSEADPGKLEKSTVKHPMGPTYHAIEIPPKGSKPKAKPEKKPSSKPASKPEGYEGMIDQWNSWKDRKTLMNADLGDFKAFTDKVKQWPTAQVYQFMNDLGVGKYLSSSEKKSRNKMAASLLRDLSNYYTTAHLTDLIDG